MKWFNTTLILLLVVTALSCTQLRHNGKQAATIPALSAEQHAQRIMTQKLDKEAEEKRFFQELAASIRSEPQNMTWAGSKEVELRKSYMTFQDVPKGGIKEIDCRSSRCIVRLGIESNLPEKKQIRQRIAIDQWISWSQPCSFAKTHGPGSVQVFLDCRQ